MSDQICDESALLEECDGDKDLLTHYVEIFDRDCATRMPKIGEAISQGDSETVQNEAHALKGGLGCLFATAGFQTAYELESMGAEGDLSGADEVLRKLASQIESLRQKLAEMIQT